MLYEVITEKVLNMTFDSCMDCGSTIGDVKSEEINEEQKEKLIDIIGKQDIVSSKMVENTIGQNIVKTKIEDVGIV